MDHSANGRGEFSLPAATATTTTVAAVAVAAGADLLDHGRSSMRNS